MMDPDAPSPPPMPWPPLVSGINHGSSAEKLPGEAKGLLRLPHTQRKALPSCPFQDSDSSDDSFASIDSNVERLHLDIGREHVGSGSSGHGERSKSPSGARPTEQTCVPEQPSAATETAADLMTAAAFLARSSKMFVLGLAGPTESGIEPAASAVDKALIKLAWATVSTLTGSTMSALSKSFGNFDQVVAVGWLIADAVGLPLLEKSSAHAVGLKARRVASTLKADIAAIYKSVNDKVRKQKLASDDTKRIKLEQDAADAECALLCEPIDLPLPDSSQSVKASKRGSHKCAQEPTPTQKTARAQEAILAAEKAVRMA